MAAARRLAVAGALLALACSVGCQTPGIGPRALRVWAVSDMTTVTPAATPEADPGLFSPEHGIQLVAALRETVAFQVLLRHDTQRPSEPLQVTLSDLQGDGGTLAADRVMQRFVVHYRTLNDFESWYPAHTGRDATPRVVADVLVPWDAPRGGGPLTLPPATTGAIWIDLRVPAATTPGTYRGTITVHSQRGGPPRSIPLRLRVLPIVLPAEPALPVVARVEPLGLLRAHFGWPLQPAEELRLSPTATQHQAAARLLDHTVRELQAHQLSPALFAAFPKFRYARGRAVEIDWSEYDALAAAWVSGDAFENRGRLPRWPVPANADYPSPERNGGFQSAQYARLLAAYIDACVQRFRSAGWSPRSFFRPLAPGPLDDEALTALERYAGIVRQSERFVPLVAHVPMESPAVLGWHGAPQLPPLRVGIWAPPANLVTPAGVARVQAQGNEAWFVPTAPPYSPSLSAAAPATDPRALGWQAYRYHMDGIWLENVLPQPPENTTGASPLVYPGVEFGLADRVVPTVRLKRLRRGLLDHALLDLLDRNGKPRLAQSTARRVFRWGFADAAITHLLDTRPAGWQAHPALYELARRLLLAEIVETQTPGARNAPVSTDQLRADWARVAQQSLRIETAVRGIRLVPSDTGLTAFLFCDVLNGSEQPLVGHWRVTNPPIGWTFAATPPQTIAPGARHTHTITGALSGLAYNASGTYDVDLQFDATTRGSFPVRGRLAVASVPITEDRLRVDGDLRDWRLVTSNAAGDFRLVRGDGRNGDRSPDLPTTAYFTIARDTLYIAIRCSHPANEQPRWEASNRVSIDGAIPWNQDLVEIILAPDNPNTGTADDLRILQIKPSGLVIARRGPRTEPPICASEPWQSEARVAVRQEQNAWTVEVAIPVASLGAGARFNRVWGCNITRCDARRGQYSSWSGARGFCYASDLLGNLVVLWP